MSNTRSPQPPAQRLHDKRYRRVLWTVLAINATMLFLETIAGLTAGSTSLPSWPITESAYSSLAWRSTTGQEPHSQGPDNGAFFLACGSWPGLSCLRRSRVGDWFANHRNFPQT